MGVLRTEEGVTAFGLLPQSEGPGSMPLSDEQGEPGGDEVLVSGSTFERLTASAVELRCVSR